MYENGAYQRAEKFMIPYEAGASKRALLQFACDNYYKEKMVNVEALLLVKGDTRTDNYDILYSTAQVC